jgi:CRP/FNR family transcriptional regulator, dissimilatory nitrate respiration regulator
MTSLRQHPEYNLARLQLRQNRLLSLMTPEMWEELEDLLSVETYDKEGILLAQGRAITQQYFILEGVVERRVAGSEGREMILRFATEGDVDGAFAGWRLNTSAPFSIVAAARVRVASVPVRAWAAFLDRYPQVKEAFDREVMRVMNEIMLHTVSLHLMDAPGRVHRFMRKHPGLIGRVPKKRLASFLNLAPETLCRLKQRGKIPGITRQAAAEGALTEEQES